MMWSGDDGDDGDDGDVGDDDDNDSAGAIQAGGWHMTRQYQIASITIMTPTAIWSEQCCRKCSDSIEFTVAITN